MSRGFTFPDVVLEQHMAVLGKTGSGKSSTSKLAIEQAVAAGARVCVLDPIKSDWWGLTSSADGRKAGLPFHILGGPHGHVPLHSSAGKAIAEVVASGALPLSIVDMADFEPGGSSRFFVDFAQTLLRKMRGVVYLVLEEAHLFAPKERSGIGQENLAIHWAKTLATAGRSKGVRLVLVTQRTQALHNALLGSCDTVIAHRLTAPADQAPVISWLKANTSKAVLEQVTSSLSSLKTGEGWICAGEAKLFSRVHFPRITTYDNTATPTGAGETHEVTTAAVDAGQLRTLIGEAVEQAKQDDPKELRKQITDLKRQLAERPSLVAANSEPTIVQPVLTEADRELLKDVGARLTEAARLATVNTAFDVDDFLAQSRSALDRFRQDITNEARDLATLLNGTLADQRFQQILDRLLAPQPEARAFGRRFEAAAQATMGTLQAAELRGFRVAPRQASVGPGDPSVGKSGLRRMLIALAQRPAGLTRRQLGLRAQVSAKGGSFDTYLSKARVNGWIDSSGDRIVITDVGIAALGAYEPLPEGRALLEHYLREFGSSGASRMLAALADAYPDAMSRADLSARANVSAAGGSFDTYLSKLRTLELIQPGRELRASAELCE